MSLMTDTTCPHVCAGTMTEAVKPERKASVEPKPPPAPPKAQKLCGLGMRVTEEPPHRYAHIKMNHENTI
jgi:hypothetical protein